MFVRASSPRISGNLGNFHKICSATLTSVRHADFSHMKDACHPLTMLCMDDDEGAIKLKSSSLRGIINVSVYSS